MIEGEFLATGIVVPITFIGDENEVTISVTIDTGFECALMLPRSIVASLGLRQSDNEVVMLADGSRVKLPIYKATILWHDEEKVVPVHAADGRALLGLELLNGSIGTFEFFPGGTTVIEEAI